MIWIWKPKVSIGNMIFGNKISLPELPFEALLVDKYESENYMVYEVKKERIRFAIENNILVSVECFGSVIYNGNELIGIDFDLVSKLFDISKCTVTFHEGFGREIICEELAAIFWEEDGKLESISMGAE